MDLITWVGILAEDEKGYVSRCIDFWSGHNGGHPPEVPPSIGRVKADLLRYHTKALLEDFQYKTKKIKKQTRMLSLRIPAALEETIKIKAKMLGESESNLIPACIELALPAIEKHPRLIKYFE